MVSKSKTTPAWVKKAIDYYGKARQEATEAEAAERHKHHLESIQRLCEALDSAFGKGASERAVCAIDPELKTYAHYYPRHTLIPAAVANIDGYQFTLHRRYEDDRDRLYLIYRCPACGGVERVEAGNTLDLGAALAHWPPAHKCRKPDVPTYEEHVAEEIVDACVAALAAARAAEAEQAQTESAKTAAHLSDLLRQVFGVSVALTSNRVQLTPDYALQARRYTDDYGHESRYLEVLWRCPACGLDGADNWMVSPDDPQRAREEIGKYISMDSHGWHPCAGKKAGSTAEKLMALIREIAETEGEP